MSVCDDLRENRVTDYFSKMSRAKLAIIIVIFVLVIIAVITTYLVFRFKTSSQCDLQESTLLNIIGCEPNYTAYLQHDLHKTIKFYYFLDKDTKELLTLENIPNLLQRKDEVKIITHGFLSSSSKGPGPKIKDAYFTSYPGKHNIILVDWSELAYPTHWYNFWAPNYCQAARNILLVGNSIGQLADKLVSDGIADFSQIHLIGHSLGAHASAIAGEHIKSLHNKNYKIGRITGLDPAGTSFYNNDTHGELRLSDDDASFVDVIHTNANKAVARRRKRFLQLGYTYTSGHADFYPNGGRSQPECRFWNGCCSHSQAYRFMAESIMEPKKFPSRPCRTLADYNLGSCSLHQEEYMGEHVSWSARGSFFLETIST